MSILDQGAFSGSNFVLSLLLARWLPPGDYGGYAVTFSIFLFAAGFHNALILEPMYVLGALRPGDEARRYLGTLVWLHGALTIIMSVALACAAVVCLALHLSFGGSMLALAVATPLILLFWLFRAACYVQTRPDLALRGSLVYGILVIGAPFLAFRIWYAPAFAAFFCLAMASFGAAALLLPALRIQREDIAWSTARRRLRSVTSENWRYGRWVTGSAVVFWLNGTFYLPLVGLFAGLSQAGAFQALQNILRPMQQSGTALGTLFLPHASRLRVAQEKGRFQRTIGRIIGANAALSLAYLLVILLARDWIIEFVYRRSYYTEFAALLPLLWLAALLSGVTQGLTIGLKSAQRSDLLFWVHLLGAIATVTLGLACVRFWKIQGAAIGSVLSALLLAAGNLVAFMPYLRGKK